MRSGIRWRSSGPESRLLRTGLALVLSASIPAQAMALTGPINAGPPKVTPKAPKPAAVSVFSDAESVKAKVESSLLDAFSAQDKVTYLVKLRTQADVSEAAAQARKTATAARAELAARGAVISSLQEAAAISQAGLVGFLEKAQAVGMVSEYKPFWITNMVAVTSDQATMEKIASRPEVEAVYKSGEIYLIESDTATLEREIEALAGAPEWNIERVGAPSVWNQFGIDGTGVVVASLDTGVDHTHPALQNQYRGNGAADHTYTWYDAVNNRTTPYDDHGHGTHTVGTMVGRDASGDNIIGVAPGAQWIGAKILNGAGSGTDLDILEAAQWLMAPGGDPSKAPDVVNNSWGGGPGLDEWFRPMVASWRAAGIVPVFANGNDGPGAGTVAAPGNYPESIGVGATTRTDDLAGFSGQGPSPYGEIKPDLSAPGSGVRSSLPNGQYGASSGTSMAAPHVAGVAALLKSANAALTVDEIEELLLSTADPTTDAQFTTVPNNGFGYGIANAYRAVAEVLGMGEGTISGRLVTEGDDLDAPVISHTPVTESFKNTPTTIIAEVQDDVSLTGVYLRFRQPGLSWWGIVDMTQTAGDHTGGTFEGAIPAELSTTDTIEYYIEAVDYGNNHSYSGSKTRPHVITLLDGITAGYMQDFEGAAAGWITMGTPEGLWQIGEPTSGPGSAYSGTRVAATNLSGDYASSATAFLVSPPVDLPTTPAALRFKHWYSMENGWDYGYVTITDDYGENWWILDRFTNANGAWQEVVVDLADYAGQSGLFIGFVLQSDGSVTRPGWYIDDVELYVDTEAPDAPTNLSAEGSGVGAIALTWDASSAGDLAHYTVYRSNTSGEGYTALGNTTAASYMDLDVTAGTEYFYVVTASDVFANESGYSNEASFVAPEVAVRFADNMENGQGGWTLAGANNSWELGAPTSGPGRAFSGENLWATNLAGNYPSSANATLTSPFIDLSGLSSASLQFTHWYSLERNFDFGRVEVSNDSGASWTQVAQYSSPASGGAPVGPESPIIDLSAYAGQTIQIRFRHSSDSSVQYAGWYVDDVVVAGVEESASQIKARIGLEQPINGLTGAKPTAGQVVVKPGASLDPVSASAMKNGLKPDQVVQTKALSQPMPKAASSGYRVDNGSTSVGIMALPAEGTVTVVETGRVVRTNPADGSYSIALPSSTYTLRAESYGYYPQEKSVTVVEDENVTVNFRLEPIPHGTLTGTITNSRDGSPIEGATISVVEDPRIAPAQTDANGEFTLDVLAGSYTVKINHPDFYGETMEVEVPGNETVTIDVSLRPFVGLPGELAYDDGSADNAWAFYDAGNGWAVRMTADAMVQVTGARVYLWDASWPGSGADDFIVAVYGAKADGSPGDLLAGPVLVEDGNLGGWNDVDLREFGVSVQGDFYVAMIQANDHPNVPGMAFDETTDEGRTWQVIDGAWGPWTEGGNAMIRALISTEVGAPLITAPADNSFTNQTEVAVEGKGIAGTTVTIYVDDVAAATVAPAEDGSFSATVTLAEGEHVLKTTASTAEGATTDFSAPVHVTVDLTAPELSISAPDEGASQNHRLLTVTGTAVDAHLATVTVNGTEASVDEAGAFTAEIIISNGENLITVTANDLAGNAATTTRTVTVDSVGPELTGLQPDADQSLVTGDSLTVSFESEPGLALAAFKIVADLGGGQSANDQASFELEPGEVAMTETAPGHYEGTFTVPEGMSLPAAYVQFRAMDAAGNTTRATAPGLLAIGEAGGEDPGDPGDPGDDPEEPEEPEEPAGPEAVIVGPESVRINKSATWDARQSISETKIVKYRWDMGDGKTYTKSTAKHTYKRTGTYTITLTITDENGNTATTTMTVEVTRR